MASTTDPDHARAAPPERVQTAFVLGGGGYLGAHEVGMLRALLEAGVRPDLVLGASVGAINGAAVAAEPSSAAVDRLEQMWIGLGGSGVFGGSLFERLGTIARSRTHLYSNALLHKLLTEGLPAENFEQLPVTFQCVAASIESAAERWFDRGPLVPAVLASCAVPGLLPPVPIDGEHYLDGGLVHSIPVGRAVELGARTVYVLHVGRIERPLRVPSRPWEVAAVAFEIARRHRFSREMADLPADVTVHVLPTGIDVSEQAELATQLRFRDFSRTQRRIDQAYQASTTYLAAADLAR